MKCGKKIFLQFVVLCILVAAVPSVVLAQFNSAAQPIALNATLAESLTVGLSASTVNFTLAAGQATNAGSTGVTATTAWVLKPGRTAVTVNAYFASAAAALSGTAGNTVTIPSSAFSITDTNGASGALTATVPTAAGGTSNAGLQLASVAITGANKNSNRTDPMTFNINLTGLPQLPADTYTGTLNIAAQATP